MANKEHLHRLKSGVETWNEWTRTNWPVKPDLSQADLSRMNLYRASLAGVNLSRANLYRANLRRATLNSAQLREANLGDADLSQAECGWADFSQANLRQATLYQAVLRQADLRGADLSEADLSQANLRKANLNGADLRRAKLYRADLRQADLREATLDQATLTRTVYDETTLWPAGFMSLSSALRSSPLDIKIRVNNLPPHTTPGDLAEFFHPYGEIISVNIPADRQADSRAKVCDACGYLHPIFDPSDGPDLCENCDTLLPQVFSSLFRMQNVSTQRRDRINSDEEERVRMGYELQTCVRFAEHGGRPAYRVATVKAADGRDLLKLTYGSAATIWRINKGWRRRQNKNLHGFILDVERGYWQKNQQELEPDEDDPMSERTQRVVPFVEDHRNCLLIEFAERYDLPMMASLQPALKSAIQVLYQVEDNELAVEPLPTVDDRRMMMFYESAEGGAGVLRQLVSDPEVIKQVARKALEICHFDPDTRADLRRAPRAKEDCEAACYDCLMSYYNQPDHPILDRQLTRTPLFELSNGLVSISPTSLERDVQLAILKAACDSDLEREWLDFLDERNLLLPDVAQKTIDGCDTRCDFYYSDRGVAIYVDGTPHDEPDAARQDEVITDCLVMDLGLTVLRFRHDKKSDWERICHNHAYVFGKVRA